MYSLHSAQLRNTLIRRAANRAVDRAMRRLHDMPSVTEYLDGKLGSLSMFGLVASQRFHDRMKTTPSNCRWCGEAQRDALAELEEVDG